MLRIEKSTMIDAPVEKVFEYVNDPSHAPEYMTGVHEISDVRPLPNGGYSYKVAYRIAGLHTDVMGEDIEVVPNERIVSHAHSAVDDVKFTLTFERVEDGKTRFTCVEEHTIQGGFLGKLGESFLARYYDHATELTLATLKAQIESSIPAVIAPSSPSNSAMHREEHPI